eukprot:m.882239 g.882239  ORF g.882239 m.882239 type:complete len:79 (-) comp59871_c0_seq1:2421-2657(-)
MINSLRWFWSGSSEMQIFCVSFQSAQEDRPIFFVSSSASLSAPNDRAVRAVARSLRACSYQFSSTALASTVGAPSTER